MDKNQLTGLVLVSLLVFLYFHFFAPEPMPVEEKKETPTTQLVTPDQREEATVVQEEEEAVPDSIQNLKDQVRYGVFAAGAKGTAEDVVIENENVKITLSSKGANVKRVLLKKYETYDNQPLVLLHENSSRFDLLVNTDNGPVNLSELYFHASSINEIAAEEDTVSINFTLDLGNGRKISKTYTLGGDGYQLGLDMQMEALDQVIQDQNMVFYWKDHLINQEEHIELSRNVTTVNYYLENDGYDYLSETSTEREEEQVQGAIKWVAFKQKFFTSGIIASTRFNGGQVSSEVDPNDSSTVKTTEMTLNIPVADVQTGNNDLTFFFGPNNYQILKKVTPGFAENVNLGWGPLSWINKFLIIPIFNWLENFIGNYGIIILILVVIIKLLLAPLSYKSYLSMAKTKVLKPELDEIKAKHGDDMQKAQAEQMQLYQKVGVNPLSGCIPMLLQMPILFAMFYFFPNSIELRQESFLWANDLSTYDSIFKLPFTIPFYGNHVSLFCLLMTASQLVYTWTNSQMTTVQGPMKTMQYIMPVAFLFFLNSFPAGLTFYYFVSNIFTIGQQAVIKNFVDEEKIRKVLDENKIRNVGKKKSKFQQRLEDAMKGAEEVKKQKAKSKAKK